MSCFRDRCGRPVVASARLALQSKRGDGSISPALYVDVCAKHAAALEKSGRQVTYIKTTKAL